MSNSASKITLTPFDDLFKTSNERTEDSKEKVQEIRLSELFPFKDHPFQVRDDEDMTKLVESIRQYGVLNPAIARPRPEGGYELIAGHRRKHASELAGMQTMPVLIREMDDDVATILMVDSNLQRETLLPSERAFAYKMKLDAMKRQGKRTDLTSSQVGTKLNKQRADQILAEQVGESRNQIQRFVRLTELISPLLQMVDDKKLPLNPAVEVSYLKPEEQTVLLEVMNQEESSPSIKQARRLKEFSQSGELNRGAILAIMTEEKPEPKNLTISAKKIQQYFPAEFSPAQMESVILDLLRQWSVGR